MAVEAHISELCHKHRILDEKIEKEESRPLIDAAKLTQMKKKKLQLKDEIERLQQRLN